jgi:hypothetical protein
MTACRSCGAVNPVANRFCGGCGESLAQACSACAHQNPPGHRFCGACGVSLVAHATPVASGAEGRRLFTETGATGHAARVARALQEPST